MALLVASGIGLAWPGDLRLADTQGSGIAAPGALPTATSVALAPSADVLATAAIATAQAPAPPNPAGPTSAGPSGGPGSSAALVPFSSARAAFEVSIESLPSNLARRHAQAWEPPQAPEDLIGYTWPLPHGRITDPFGPSPWGSRIVNGQLFHDGVDIATFCGDRIVGAHAGLVLAAGRKFDTTIGWVGDLAPYFARLDEKKAWWTLPISVVIDDGNGYRSIYSHFYQVVVKPGQRVKAGQLLGYEGATGRATGCHLHYGLFAPHEAATFAIEPSVVKRMLVPALQIARVDPLRVLPRRPGDEGPTPVSVPAAGHGIGE